MVLLQSCVATQSVSTLKKITVAADGSGDYKTLQGALNSLPDSSATARTIFIKKGIYSEKIYIEKANIIFEGEDREKTIIIASIARDEWRCGHMDDWGVATMNIGASDITLKNLTITNNYGIDFKERTIWCAADTSANKEKGAKKRWSPDGIAYDEYGHQDESHQLPLPLFWWRYGQSLGSLQWHVVF